MFGQVRVLHMRFEERCEGYKKLNKCPAKGRGCKGWRCRVYRQYMAAIKQSVGGMKHEVKRQH
jgi:hypothetical protein